MTPAYFSAAALREDREDEEDKKPLHRDAHGRLNPTEVMDLAVTTIARAKRDDELMNSRVIARTLSRLSGNDEEEEAASSSGVISTIAGLAWEAGKKFVVHVGKWAIRLTAEVVFTAGRFLVERALIPMLMWAAEALLTTPVGWVIGGAALGYVLYKAFFKGDASGAGTPPFSWENFRNRFGAPPSDGQPTQYPGYPGQSQQMPSIPPGSAAPQPMAQQTGEAPSEKRVATARDMLKQFRSKSVEDAIEEASALTGVDVGLLNAVAARESSFNPNIKAPKGTATGLFQFVEGTWADMIRIYGPRYGLPANAQRTDPRASAIMAAAYIKHRLYPAIAAAMGGTPSATDLYIGLFMGEGGAPMWLKNLRDKPNSPAASDFPKEASYNPGVYWDRNGNMRTYAQIYKIFMGDISPMMQAATEVHNQRRAPGPPLQYPPGTSPTPERANNGANDAPGMPPANKPKAEQPFNHDGVPVGAPQ